MRRREMRMDAGKGKTKATDTILTNTQNPTIDQNKTQKSGSKNLFYL